MTLPTDDDAEDRREAAAQMLEYLYANRDSLKGPGAETIAMILRLRVNSDGRADLSRDSEMDIRVLYRGLLSIATANGGHWRSGIDADTGRMVVELAPGDVDHDACAADLQDGYNTFGLPEAMAALRPVLDRGGVFRIPCSDCARFERAHALRIRRHDEGYEVTAVPEAASE
jgi:hypothetical protein